MRNKAEMNANFCTYLIFDWAQFEYERKWKKKKRKV